MLQKAILAPVLMMFALTATVWLYMYIRRIGFMLQNRIDPQQLTTQDALKAVVPVEINYPADNLRNLFEMPVLFYVMCLALLMTEKVDAVFVAAAWSYFVLRALHSAVHCTFNIVWLRFAAYVLSCLILWWMAGRAAVQWF